MDYPFVLYGAPADSLCFGSLIPAILWGRRRESRKFIHEIIKPIFMEHFFLSGSDQRLTQRELPLDWEVANPEVSVYELCRCANSENVSEQREGCEIKECFFSFAISVHHVMRCLGSVSIASH